MAKATQKIKIMVGSTVYGFEDQLSQIVAQLQLLDYDVLNSYNGSIKVNPNLSNLDNCLNAVKECDLFLGIIRPYYGTGNIGEKNITFPVESTASNIDEIIAELETTTVSERAGRTMDKETEDSFEKLRARGYM